MIEIQLNGKETEVSDTLSIAQLLLDRQVSPLQVVVELNGEMLPREQFGDVVLRAADVVEVVTMVGGG